MADLRHKYFAGSQEAFRAESRRIAQYGCGLIGLCDLIIYLTERSWREKAEGQTGVHRGRSYEAFVHKIDDRMARAYRKLGLNGWSMARAFNRRAKKRGWPLRARWGVPMETLVQEVNAMLLKDIPVIMSVGPGFRSPDGTKGIALYAEDGMTRIDRASDHYFTVIGLITRAGRRFFRVASWGRIYLVDTETYEEGLRRTPVLFRGFTSILKIADRS